MSSQTSSLGLSDQEFLEKDPAEFLSDEESDDLTAEQKLDIEPTTEEHEAPPSETTEEVSEAQEQTDAVLEEDEVSQPDGDTQTELEKSTDSDTAESPDTSKPGSSDTKEDTPETSEFDYERAYKKVSEPFKANGIDMQVKNPEDIIRLMQMGANYQKKMAQLKPHLKIVKMLEKNELLNEAKLYNLIDISKKDPKAIAKLVQESSIDPLDIDKDGSNDYQPTDYSVSDKEYNLDTVLDEIKDTPTFNKTIRVLTKDWDQGSKSTISDYPEIISVINTHMGNGVFDKINSVLQRDKALGKLTGIHDVDAYKQIMDQMFEQGILINDAPVDSDKDKTSSKSVSNPADNEDNADRNKKRKAVAPVKQTTSTKGSADTDFLGLSDEEFMKKYATR